MVITFLLLLIFSSFLTTSEADTLRLKNGRSIEGIVTREEAGIIELEVSGGVVKFRKSEIEKIEKSSPEEASELRGKWDEQKKIFEQNLAKQKEDEEQRAKNNIEFIQEAHNIILKVIINDKVEASLVLDTGATLVLLTKEIAGKLGINPDNLKQDATLTLADGRKVAAKYIVLESIKVQGVEAAGVEAAILMEEGVKGANFKDGLLGMSFLKRFNFKVDQKEKKLILEKL